MSLKNEELETKGIKAMIILEMIGRPADYLQESMKKIISAMDSEKSTKVISQNIKEPIELKDNKEFFTTFAEIEIRVEEIANLAILMFKYMPAHIEIIEPELIALTNNGWGDILSELVRRLHGYDEVARVLQYKNTELEKKLKELSEIKPEEKIKKTKKKKKSSNEAELQDIN
jgi:hypothetical protein